VFQFQNVPGAQRTNTTNTNAGGYAASMMRKYLVPIDGAASGSFYNGLLAAGVPANVLWAPKRNVAKNYNDAATASCNTIQDVLWLPTEWEIYGSRSHSPLSEKAANQTHLEYYDNNLNTESGGNPRRTKYDMNGWTHSWRLATPYYLKDTYFLAVGTSGYGNITDANYVGGIAPAFCVR
jgi:hypothetical protein